MKKSSEFGKGVIYPLVLFCNHFIHHAYDDHKENYNDFISWFNGASDHLYELEIPVEWKKRKLGKKLKELQDLALDIGHGNLGLMDSNHKKAEKFAKASYDKCVLLVKEIAFLLDKELGFKPIKGDWE